MDIRHLGAIGLARVPCTAASFKEVPGPLLDGTLRSGSSLATQQSQASAPAKQKEPAPKAAASKASKEAPKAAAAPKTAPAPAAAPASAGGGGTQAQIDALAGEIRAMKEKLKSEGLSGKKIDASPEIKEMVTRLQALKASAPSEGAKPAGTAPPPPGGTPVTDPVYLTDTYLLQLEQCKVLEAKSEPSPEQTGASKLTLVLDRTVFHPQGGGQPTDKGTIKAAGKPDLEISMVSMRKDDKAICHDSIVPNAVAETWSKTIGSVVSCAVDKEHRVMCARIHSAGHLLDAAVQELALKWIPGKGYHFSDGAYVEYLLDDKSVKVDMKKPAAKDEIVKKIQDATNALITKGGKVNVRYEQGVRHVEMAGEECPCGGTHVTDISQIQGIEVKKLQNKQGNMRVSYAVKT